MKKCKFKLLIALVLMTSCQEEDVITVQNADEPQTVTSPYAIPLDSALSYLDDFLKENSNLK